MTVTDATFRPGQSSRGTHRVSAGTEPSDGGHRLCDTQDDSAPVGIYQAVTEACDRYQSIDSAKVAHRILAEVTDLTRLRALMLPLVTQAVDIERRRATRHGEERAFTPSARRPVTVTGGQFEPDIARLRTLLHQKFKVDRGGDEVTWGEATAPQHRSRAAALRKHIEGTARTVAYHDWSAAKIEAAGAVCLADVLRDEAA